MRIANDYNDMVALPVTPDIVTTTRAHPTQYTDGPYHPRINFGLRGSAVNAQRARFGLGYKHVHNAPTNIRQWDGGTKRNGNFIFIFKITGLCIDHLDQAIYQQQPDATGRLDVALMPVDGSRTPDLDGWLSCCTRSRRR